MIASIFFSILGLLIAPMLLGIINKTKAFYAGRKGAPILQPYYTLSKLLKKGAVYSDTTTTVFRAGPIIGLASVIIASFIVPICGVASSANFIGDLILFAYLLGLARFFTVVAALDTGSTFEAMGGSREVWISTLAEPALFLVFCTLAHHTGEMSMSNIFASLSYSSLSLPILLGIALFIIVLAENSRLPVDDPNTHLELTMVHEVMILDHCGVDLAFIMYGAAIKLWITGSILINVILPIKTASPFLNGAFGIIAMFILAVVIGIVESSIARLRFNKIPEFLILAVSCAAIALAVAMKGG